MPTAIRQSLFAAVISRFQSITTTGGYATNVGRHVFGWRDTSKQPFSAPELAHGALNVRDIRKTTEQGGPAVLGKHHHSLTINVEGAVSEGTAADTVRAIIADVEKAVGVDRKWGGLAFDTVPGSDELTVAQNGTTLCGFSMTFTIEFRTGNWAPFNA